MIVATGVYALLLKFLQKNSPHNVHGFPYYHQLDCLTLWVVLCSCIHIAIISTIVITVTWPRSRTGDTSFHKCLLITIYTIYNTQHTQRIKKSKSSRKLVSRSSRLIGSPKREYFPQKICDGDLADPNAGQWCGNSPLPYLHFLQGNVNSIFTSSSSLRTARFLILSNLQLFHLELDSF